MANKKNQKDVKETLTNEKTENVNENVKVLIDNENESKPENNNFQYSHCNDLIIWSSIKGEDKRCVIKDYRNNFIDRKEVKKKFTYYHSLLSKSCYLYFNSIAKYSYQETFDKLCLLGMSDKFRYFTSNSKEKGIGYKILDVPKREKEMLTNKGIDCNLYNLKVFFSSEFFKRINGNKDNKFRINRLKLTGYSALDCPPNKDDRWNEIYEDRSYVNNPLKFLLEGCLYDNSSYIVSLKSDKIKLKKNDLYKFHNDQDPEEITIKYDHIQNVIISIKNNFEPCLTYLGLKNKFGETSKNLEAGRKFYSNSYFYITMDIYLKNGMSKENITIDIMEPHYVLDTKDALLNNTATRIVNFIKTIYLYSTSNEIERNFVEKSIKMSIPNNLELLNKEYENVNSTIKEIQTEYSSGNNAKTFKRKFTYYGKLKLKDTYCENVDAIENIEVRSHDNFEIEVNFEPSSNKVFISKEDRLKIINTIKFINVINYNYDVEENDEENFTEIYLTEFYSKKDAVARDKDMYLINGTDILDIDPIFATYIVSESNESRLELKDDYIKVLDNKSVGLVLTFNVVVITPYSRMRCQLDVYFK